MQESNTDGTDETIRHSIKLVLVVVAITISVFFVWFVILNKAQLSADSAHWGQFGDFFGGILNPLIAFSALFWLTRSVKLQKTELEKTRVALIESADSQARHAHAAEKAMRITGYAAILNAAVLDIQSNQQYSTSLLERASNSNIGSAMLRNGEIVERDGVLNELKRIGLKIDESNAKKRKAELQLRLELNFQDV